MNRIDAFKLNVTATNSQMIESQSTHTAYSVDALMKISHVTAKSLTATIH
jgi:hypothetical protein